MPAIYVIITFIEYVPEDLKTANNLLQTAVIEGQQS